MFSKLQKNKYEKKINSSYIENDFSKKTLYNFYGESNNSRIEYIPTPSSIRNEAAKQIAILKYDLKKEGMADRKLIKKIKHSKQIKMNAKVKSAKYAFASTKIEISENVKNFDKNKNIGSLAKKYINIEKKNIKNSLKIYNLQKKGIRNSGDSIEQKNIAIGNSYKLVKKTQYEANERILILSKIVLNEKMVNELKNHDIVKKLIAEHQLIIDKNEESEANKVTLNSKCAMVKISDIKSAKDGFKHEMRDEKEFSRDKKFSKIELIGQIRKNRDDAIKKYKENRKIKKTISNKNLKTLKNLVLYLEYYLKVFPIVLMVSLIKPIRLYKKNVGQRFFLRSELFKKLKENSILNSWNYEYYSKEETNWRNSFKKFTSSESKIMDSFLKEKDHFINLKINLIDEQKKLKLIHKKNIEAAKLAYKNGLVSLKQQLKNEKISEIDYKLDSKKLLLTYKNNINKVKLRNPSFKIKSENKTRLKVLRAKRKNRDISKLAFKNDKKYSRILKKDSLKKLKLQGEFFRAKNDRKESCLNLWINYSANLKDSNDLSEYNIKKIPIEVAKGTRLIFMILNFFVGGLAYILAKQFKKGFLFLTLTIFFYTFFIPFIFGMSSVGGNGIQGLSSLGKGIFKADSRFYIVEGVYAFLLLMVVSMYLMINAFSGYRLGLLMERGVRPNSWFISKKLLDKVHLPYLLSIPAVLVVIFTVLAPLVTLLLLAFTDWGKSANPIFGETISWVGFKNFTILFDSNGIGPQLKSEFGGILGWTLIWGIATWGIGLVINVFVSLLVNSERIKFTAFWRTIMILPMAIPAFIMILMFRVLISSSSGIGTSDGGPLYYLLIKMHLWSETILNSNGTNTINDTMQNKWFVRIFLIIISFWFGLGGGMLYFTGIMQGISPSLYEAAKVDGAGAWKQHKTITLPHLFFIIAPTLLPGFITALNNYALIWLFNDGGPDVATSITGAGQSDIILSWVYKLIKDPTEFNNSIGLTSVICVFFGAISILISAPGVFKSKMFKEGDW